MQILHSRKGLQKKKKSRSFYLCCKWGMFTKASLVTLVFRKYKGGPHLLTERKLHLLTSERFMNVSIKLHMDQGTCRSHNTLTKQLALLLLLSQERKGGFIIAEIVLYPLENGRNLLQVRVYEMWKRECQGAGGVGTNSHANHHSVSSFWT